MTTKDRLARAVRDARALPGANPVARVSDVDRRVVTAILTELRTPSPEMVEAGVDSGPVGCCIATDREVMTIFTAMIDAIGGEG